MLHFMKQLERSGIPWPVFAVTVAAAFMVALDLSIVNVAFPSIRRSFPEVSTATLSWVLAAYSVVFGALLLGAGRIADRSGRRRVFLLGLLIFSAGSLLCGIAPSAWLLIVGRVVQAIGAALLMPASLALLLSATAPAARAQAVAMWGGVSALAVATGPSLGSVLIDAGGWRWAFFVNLPVALVAGIAARRIVPESIVGGRVPDLVGVALLSAAVAALALAITQGGDWGWSSYRVVGSFVAAAVLAPIAIRRSTRHVAPAIDLDVFRSRTVVLANAATFLYSVGFFGMLLANVLFLTSVWEYSTLQAGLAITPGPLLVAALSGPAGRLAARVGYRPARRRRPAPGPLRHRRPHQPDRPPDRRRARRRPAHRNRRHATLDRPGHGTLPYRLAGRSRCRPLLGCDLLVPPPTRRDHRGRPGPARPGGRGVSFAADTAVTRIGPGCFTADLHERWSSLVGIHGGYTAAIVVNAMTAAVDDPTRALRSFATQFAAIPRAGPVDIEVTVERTGKSMTTTSARLLQEGRGPQVAHAASS